MVQYGGMNRAFSILSLIALAAFLAFFYGLAGIFIKQSLAVDKSFLLPLVVIPLIWVSRDLVIENILGGFPWCLAGYSQYTNIYFVQVAEIGGIHLVTFVLIYFNVLLYRLMRARDRQTAAALLISLIAIYTAGYYLYRSNEAHAAGLPTHRAGIIQPNTGNRFISRRETDKILDRLLEESRELARQGAEFVVWPEHTVRIYPLQYLADYYRLTGFARDNVPLLAGFTDQVNNAEVYNSAVLFQKDTVQKYDKVHLTPFGEYVLFREVLFFIQRITEEIADFTPGAQVRNLEIQGRAVAPPICYEIIFPELVRTFISRGGELIVTISNDSWFGSTSAPYQHLCMAVYRSIENRRYILRSTTNGVSALINSSGEIRYRSPYGAADRFIAPFKYIGKKTVFTRFGYLFPYCCLLLLAIYLAVFFRPVRRKFTPRRG
jgi:apolipoprotein N-acyltransferase